MASAGSALKRFRYVHLAGFTPEEYELYELARRSRSEAEEYISAAQMWNVIEPALNDARYRLLLGDKWVFARFARSFDLPVPRTLGLFEPDLGRTWEGAPLRTAADLRALLAAARPAGLVAKPVTGRLGRGVVFCEVSGGEEVALAAREGPLSPDAFVTGLIGADAGAAGGFVLQERLAQHPMLLELNPDTFNVLRVQTLARPDGSVVVDRVVARIGRRGDVVPSLLREGGLTIAVVDLDAGTLGEGMIRMEHGPETFRAHPETGVAFTGRKLPHWDQVLEVSKRAARAVHWQRAIGWDIGLTPEGAVVIEGNSAWNPGAVQGNGRGYLTPELRAALAAAGVHSPQATPTLAMARRRLGRRLRFALRRRLRV